MINTHCTTTIVTKRERPKHLIQALINIKR